MHFVGSAPGKAHSADEAYRDTAAIFPESVNTVVSYLQVFPNLETLSINSDYHFNDWSEWKRRWRDTDKDETDKEVKRAEEEIAWRALMAKSYEAMIRNKAIKLKRARNQGADVDEGLYLYKPGLPCLPKSSRTIQLVYLWGGV